MVDSETTIFQSPIRDHVKHASYLARQVNNGVQEIKDVKKGNLLNGENIHATIHTEHWFARKLRYIGDYLGINSRDISNLRRELERPL